MLKDIGPLSFDFVPNTLVGRDDKFVDFTFGRGSYIKTIILLALLYIIAYIAIMGIGLGFFSEIIAGDITVVKD